MTLARQHLMVVWRWKLNEISYCYSHCSYASQVNCFLLLVLIKSSEDVCFDAIHETLNSFVHLSSTVKALPVIECGAFVPHDQEQVPRWFGCLDLYLNASRANCSKLKVVFKPLIEILIAKFPKLLTSLNRSLVCLQSNRLVFSAVSMPWKKWVREKPCSRIPMQRQHLNLKNSLITKTD